MDEKSEAGMQEAVEQTCVVLAVITGDSKDDPKSYFNRPFCLKELRWAFAANKRVQPVVGHRDKERIGELIRMAPGELSSEIARIDFVDMNLTDKAFWKVGLDKIIKKARQSPKAGAFFDADSSTKEPMGPLDA